MRRLPFLNGARAFEAAARTGSFAAAAAELNVTPAAVSRMVKLLEDRLGITKVRMTPSCTAALELAAMLCDLGPRWRISPTRSPRWRTLTC